MQNLTQRLTVWIGAIGVLLTIPLVAMQYTQEVDWTASDFVFMGILMFSIALAYELIARKGGSGAYRGGVALAVATTFLLVWVNAAVGIIGDGPVNMLYLGVPVVGLLGVFIARFKADGMSRAAFSMAIVQMLVPATVLLLWGSDVSWQPGVVLVFMLSAGFSVLYVGSALLFRRAHELPQPSYR